MNDEDEDDLAIDPKEIEAARLRVRGGDSFSVVASRAYQLALKKGIEVTFRHNGIEVTLEPQRDV